MSPAEISILFRTLDSVGTIPTLKLDLKLILLTMVNKGELLYARWSEVDFEAATWMLPAERMKARRQHVVYLPQQAGRKEEGDRPPGQEGGRMKQEHIDFILNSLREARHRVHALIDEATE